MFNIIDIGGSFIKIYNSYTKEVKRIKMIESNIINLKELKNIIKIHIDDNCEKIYLSCQMHGFVLFNKNKENISEFVTLKHKSNNIINNIIPDDIFTKITGLTSRNDLPINNIYEFIINNNLLNDKIFVKNISEAILDIDLSNTHITMACGNGFFDINLNQYSQKIIDYFYNEFKIELLFDNPISDISINGYLNINNINIPVYSGIGDFQASLSSIKNNELYINMATGSQISILTNNIEISENKLINYRPFFENKYLKCITHIPSGRFLNNFLDLFPDLFTYNLTIEDIIESNLIITNDIFDNSGLSINNIIYNLNKKNIIGSIFKSYLDQYINYYNIYFKELNIDRIILTGGIPKKIPYIKKYFEFFINKKIIINYDCDDDSIFGILKLINK
jgi:hypothetical protein